MRISILKILYILILFSSCRKLEVPEEREPVGIGAPNAFVLECRYVSHSGNELFIQMDVGVVSYAEAKDDLSIGDTAFKNMSLTNSDVEVLSVDHVQLNQNENFSTLLLMDVSENWANVDNFNLRLRAMNKVIIDTKSNPQNEIALGSYARNGVIDAYVSVWTWLEGLAYSQTIEELGKIAFVISTYGSGTSSYYDAVNDMLDFVAVNSNHPNKSLTVVNLGTPDSPNTTTALITKAKNLNIKVNQIFLSNIPTVSMGRLALETGGFLNIISSTSYAGLMNDDIMDKGTPMIASIERVLSKNLHVYRLNLKIIKTSGTWTSGFNYFDRYEISERYASGELYVNNYLPIYVQIP